MSWSGLLDRRGFVFVLVGLWAVAYLPFLGTRDLRLEEGRRATPAREMLESGDFVRPTLYGETYLNKPPLYFWLVAAIGSVLGEVTPFVVRLPSVLAALGCALLATRFALPELDRRTRHLAGLFTIASATLLDKGTLGEIDPTLTLLVAAAFKSVWDGYGPDRQSTRSWLQVGLWLGLAVLSKGPAGPAIFYLGVVPFLVWERRLGRLFTVGHALCIGLAALPVATWIGLLIERGVVQPSELVNVWVQQLGVDNVAVSRLDWVRRWAEFPLQLLGMFIPGVVWAAIALVHRKSNALQRLLICAAFVPCVAFWLYPEARARHVMPVVFPIALLGAIEVMRRESSSRWSVRAGHMWSLVPGLFGIVGLLLALTRFPGQLVPATATFVAGLTWTWFSLRRTNASGGPIATAIPFAGALLAGWMVANAVLFPGRANRAPTRIARAEVHIHPNEVVHTTRTFPVTGEGYYNLQFHLAHRLKAVDLIRLRSAAPCLALVTPAECAELQAEGWSIVEVRRIVAAGGPPEVLLIRLRAANEIPFNLKPKV